MKRRSFLKTFCGAVAAAAVVLGVEMENRRRPFTQVDFERFHGLILKRERISLEYDGKPPYSPEELKAEGIKWRSALL